MRVKKVYIFKDIKLEIFNSIETLLIFKLFFMDIQSNYGIKEI